MATPAESNRILYITASATTTIQSYGITWSRCRSTGTMNSLTGYPMTGTLSPGAADAGGGTNYAINRSVVWLDTPELFGGTGTVFLRLLGSGSSGITLVKCALTSSEPITLTDGADGYNTLVWESIHPEVLFSTAVSSSMSASSYMDIALNSEAKRWILSGSQSSRRIVGSTDGYGFAVGIINYAYDYLDTAPAAGTTHNMFLDTTSSLDDRGDPDPTLGPSTTIDGVWLTGSRGAEPTYTKDDYVIIPYDNDITRYPRRIPQTPYGLSIKGPSSLRGKNVPYKVTS